MNCSLARSLELVGDWWNPLILRDVTLGIRRFDELADDLGMSRNLLTRRLGDLVEGGLLERRAYQDHPPRYDYVLTEAGRDLMPVLMALTAWGDRWVPPRGGPPMSFVHRSCQREFVPTVVCSECGTPVTLDDISAQRGPGARRGRGTRVMAERLAPRATAS